MSDLNSWNLWHGCHKKSEGCRHCYVYRRDAQFEKDANVVTKTSSFNLPVRRDRSGQWKVPSGTLMWTCFTSDFFIEDADGWRDEAWRMIRVRNDLSFFMITKRPERILQCLPDDWGDGWDHVTVCCTMENQRRAVPLQADRRTFPQGRSPVRHSEEPADAAGAPCRDRLQAMTRRLGTTAYFVLVVGMPYLCNLS